MVNLCTSFREPAATFSWAVVAWFALILLSMYSLSALEILGCVAGELKPMKNHKKNHRIPTAPVNEHMCVSGYGDTCTHAHVLNGGAIRSLAFGGLNGFHKHSKFE